MQSKSVPLEIVFAQQLAANFETVRNKAFKKVRKWLAARSVGQKPFTREEFLKIWKGLFYCMWMRDKPLLQEQLAQDISMLIHSIGRPKLSILFIDTFFETIAREWNGIDYLRMDKFMMLVRKFFRESLQFLKRLKWKPKAIQVFLKVLCKTVLHPTCDHTPEGLKMHFSDIYLQELARIGGAEFTPKRSMRFLLPCCYFLAYVENMLVQQAFEKNVFQAIIELSVNSKLEPESEEDEDDEEEEDEERNELKRFDFHSKILKAHKEELEANQDLPALPLNFESLANMLIKFGSKQDVKQKNRNQMYSLAKQFRDLANGLNPLEKGTSEPDVRDLSRKDVARAVKRRLQELEEEVMEETEWKKEDMEMTGRLQTEDLLQEEFLKTTFEEFSEGKATMKKLKADRSDDNQGKKSKLKKNKKKVQVVNGKKTSKVKVKSKVKNSKKVNFSLANNSAQDHSEYHQSVKGSPAIPFDALKTPTQGVLKKLQKKKKEISKKKKSCSTKSAPKRQKAMNAKVQTSQRMKASDFF